MTRLPGYRLFTIACLVMMSASSCQQQPTASKTTAMPSSEILQEQLDEILDFTFQQRRLTL